MGWFDRCQIFYFIFMHVYQYITHRCALYVLLKLSFFLLDDLVEFLWGVCDVQLDNRAKTDTMRTWLYAKIFNDNNNGSNNNNIEYIYNYII